MSDDNEKSVWKIIEENTGVKVPPAQKIEPYTGNECLLILVALFGYSIVVGLVGGGLIGFISAFIGSSNVLLGIGLGSVFIAGGILLAFLVNKLLKAMPR
jgi:hypothetical protein